MAEIVLFHSALGLRPGVLAWADALRADGHTLHTPDLYDGEVFDSLERAVAKRDALGIPELIRRSQAAAAALSANIYYAGFSMGAAPAQLLAVTRPGAKGAFLMHGALPLEALGVSAWPEGVAVELHYMQDDELFDPTAVDDLEQRIPKTLLHVERYPGSAHLFADPGLPEYDAAAAETMLSRARAFFAN
jgi:dienelactone hydrolase